jgi:gas vesicle protein
MTEHKGRQALNEIMERVEEITSLYPFTISGVSEEIAGYISRCSPEALRSIASLVEELEDKIEGLESDLSNAVETAFDRGAVEWAKMNYPNHPRVKALKSPTLKA